MGNQCCGGDKDDDFTNVEMGGSHASPNRKGNNNKHNTLASPKQSEEVHFEYDEQSGRLIPIIKQRKRRSHTNRDGKTTSSRNHGRSSRSQGSLSADNRSQLSDAMSNMSGGCRPDVGRSDESLVDCMSNTSYDIPLDDNTMMRMTNYEQSTSLSNNHHEFSQSRPLALRSGEASHATSGRTPVHNNSGELSSAKQQQLQQTATPRMTDEQQLQQQNENENENQQQDDDEDEEEEFTLEDLVELEEISRSEINNACMVAYQMLRFAVKRLTPTVHYMIPKAVHVDPNSGTSSSKNASSPSSESTKMNNKCGCTNDNKNGGGASTTSSGAASPSDNNNNNEYIRQSSSNDNFLSTTTVIQMMNRKQQQGGKNTNTNNNNTNSPATGDLLKPNSAEGENTNNENSNDNNNDDAHSLSSSNNNASSMMMSTSAGLPVASPKNGPTTQRVQLLEIDARNIKCDGSKVKSQWMESNWDFFNSYSGQAEKSAKQLSDGMALYGFKCFTVDKATPDDYRLISPFSNLSAYKDEVTENNVPHIDFEDRKVMKKFTIIISKAMYLLPGLEKDDIDAAYWASRPYVEACIPNINKFEDPLPHEKNTFRMHKPLIRFIFSLVIQFQITEITDPKILKELAQVDGFVPVKALLYERTKRDKSKTDMTAKAKSVLLFQQVPGGMLVSNVAAVYNTSLPGVIASIVNNFGSNGAEETEMVASQTRKHIYGKFVKPRLEKDKK